MDDPLQFALLALALALAVLPLWIGACASNTNFEPAALVFVLALLLFEPLAFGTAELALLQLPRRLEILHALLVNIYYSVLMFSAGTALYLLARAVISRPWLIWVIYGVIVAGGIGVIASNGGSIPCRYTGTCE